MVYSMSRLSVFTEADWATTDLKDGEDEEGEYFNDNAVMTLCKLFAGNKNLVDLLAYDYFSRSTRSDKESFRSTLIERTKEDFEKHKLSNNE